MYLRFTPDISIYKILQQLVVSSAQHPDISHISNNSIPGICRVTSVIISIILFQEYVE